MLRGCAPEIPEFYFLNIKILLKHERQICAYIPIAKKNSIRGCAAGSYSN